MSLSGVIRVEIGWLHLNHNDKNKISYDLVFYHRNYSIVVAYSMPEWRKLSVCFLSCFFFNVFLSCFCWVMVGVMELCLLCFAGSNVASNHMLWMVGWAKN